MTTTETLIVQPPESATWQVHIDRTMWIAGVRALMLQALHPRAMWGVWQNSDFMEDPFGRLQRTADFVGVTTFGHPDEAAELGARIRGIHRSLRGRDPGTGETFRIDDPELLRWVHCAEVGSYLEVIRRAGLPLSDADADRYLAEQRSSGTYVGLHAEDLPGTVAELSSYFASMRPELRVTEEAAATVRFLLWPKVPRRMRWAAPGKPLWFPVGALSYQALPRWARDMYRALPNAPEPLVTGALRMVRRTLTLVPEPLHDRVFQPHTRAMLTRARTRLGDAGYDVTHGLIGLRNPTRHPA